ncbi:Na(+)/H(+) antiporter subunit B [Aminivibrio sp.]|jgi:energy-converting hydrogenase B subunit D|uniref:Na(+)/H(+) antiporter subunit B n=1 Tax=Aminivibrio sp. TaxID=1872489 RepID=UPI003D99264E
MNTLLHMAVLALLVLAAFFALWFKDLVSSVIALAVFSVMTALEFYILQAPDVAIAEAAIGAGLSTTIYIIAIRACGKIKKSDGGDGR